MNSKLRWIYAICGLSIALAGSVVAQSLEGFPSFNVIDPVLASPAVNTPTAPGDPNGFLVSIRRQGGMCLPPGCISEVTIFADGTYQYSNPPSPVINGQISAMDLRMLKLRIATTNFNAIRKARPTRPIPGLCLLPVDGPEAVYTFWTGRRSGLPTDHRFEQIQGCKTPIDSRNALFQQLERLYSQISAQAVAPPATQKVPKTVANSI